MAIQLCLQPFGKRQKIMHVVERVFRHARRQRPLRPIGFLRTFRKLGSEVALHQRTQAELADAEQPRRDDCIEDFARDEIQAAAEHSQIVVGPMQDNFSSLQRPAQRLQIEITQRIDNEITL